MAGILHTYIPNRVIDSNGIADGAELAFYATGTLTKAPIYSDPGVATPLANPVVVESGAEVPNIYLDSEIIYRRIITYSDGSTFDTDPWSSPYLISASGLAYATNAAAASATVAWVVGSTFSTEGGVIAGDGGRAQWKVVASEPSHPGKIALAGGKWGEIVGPYLPVEAFGAVGDCPDVSGYNPATQQSTIAAAVTGATNDAQAFQDALHAAQAIGGAIVTYGHGKRYRLAFDHLGVFALVIGSNTTLQQLGGGWLEYDPSLLTGARPANPGGGMPARRTWPDPGIWAGDATTGLTATAALVAGTANVIPAGGLIASDFASNLAVLGVNIRCHTRVYWHALSDQTGPPVRRLRLFGLNMHFVNGLTIKDTFVKGTPNDAYVLTGRDIRGDNMKAELCGYGAVLGTACNSYSAVGYQILGSPELSSQAYAFTGCTSRYARDEGFAKAGIFSLSVNKFLSIGDHDRALEGVTGYVNTLTSADPLMDGEAIDGDCTVTNLDQDGKHQCALATTTAGNATVTLDDAFYLGIDTPATPALKRFVFIPGAGAGAGDGPFEITAVDYVANTITVSPAPSFSVVAAEAYTLSRQSVTFGDANETRVTLKGLRAKYLYCTTHAVWANASDGGRFLVDDIEIENATVPAGYNGVSLEGERVTATNIRLIGCTGSTTSAAVRVMATYGDVDKPQVDGGFQWDIIAQEFSGPAKRFTLTRGVFEGCNASAVLLYHAAKCDRITIEGNYFGGTNASGSTTDGFIKIQNPTTIGADLLSVKNNTVRWAGRQTAFPVLTTGTVVTAGAIGKGRFIGNDLMHPEMLGVQPTNSPARMLNTAVLNITDLVLRDNLMPGSRTMNMGAFPTAGRFYFGDEVRIELPVNGAVERYRCTIGGSFTALAGVTVATTSSGSSVVVNDASGIKSNDTLAFNAGANIRVVAWVDYATNTLTLTGTVSVTSGGAVAFATPVFSNESSLYLSGSKTFDPPSVAAQVGGVPGVQSTTVTVTGAALGDFVTASFSLSLGGLRLEAEVTAANTVTVYFINTTAGAIDLASGTLKVRTL